MLLTLATIAVLGVVGFRLAGAARYAVFGAGRARALALWRSIRWRHIWPVPFVLAAVMVAALALLQVPLLSFGWWTAIGGTGNPVTGTTEQTAGSPLEWVVPLVFLALLLPPLPLFALREEQVFRLGAERWSIAKRASKTLLFGLAHAIIGIPIAVALALSVGGAYFMAVYLRAERTSGSAAGAALESARAHTAYNATIVLIVLLAIGLLAAGV